MPDFIASHQHLVVSLLYLDADMYDPTKVALETFLPRIPKGAILAPGETTAALEAVGLRSLRLRRFDWDPYITLAEVD